MANYPPLTLWLFLATFLMFRITKRTEHKKTIYNILMPNVVIAKLCIEKLESSLENSLFENTFSECCKYLEKGVIVTKQYDIRVDNIPLIVL